MDPEQLKAFMDALEALKNDVVEQVAKIDAKCEALADSVGKLKKRADEDEAGTRQNGIDQTMAARTAADSVGRGEFRHLQEQVNDMRVKQMTRPQVERDAMADYQAKADVAYKCLGIGMAPAPMQAEDVVSYAIRLHRPLMKHAKRFKGAELAVLAADRSTFDAVLDSVRADAYEAGMSPGDAPPFVYREVKTESPGGHRITSFVGNGTIFRQLSRPGRYVVGFHNESRLGRPGVPGSSGGSIHAQ